MSFIEGAREPGAVPRTLPGCPCLNLSLSEPVYCFYLSVDDETPATLSVCKATFEQVAEQEFKVERGRCCRPILHSVLPRGPRMEAPIRGGLPGEMTGWLTPLPGERSRRVAALLLGQWCPFQSPGKGPAALQLCPVAGTASRGPPLPWLHPSLPPVPMFRPSRTVARNLPAHSPWAGGPVGPPLRGNKGSLWFSGAYQKFEA